ncbi:MAG: hypothetical protein ACI9DK_002474 [Vicingaceae bacterium]|jgi:hypothetical protein
MKRLTTAFCLFILLNSCTEVVSLEERLNVELDSDAIQQKGPLTIVAVVYKQEYALEKLTLKKEAFLMKTNRLNLQFEEKLPQGYEIRYSVNNGEVLKSESTDLEVQLLKGNNVVLAFLALANGLRIPNKNAVYLKNHFVGEEEQDDVTETGIHLFHNVSSQVDSAAFYLDFYGKNVPEESNYFARVIADGNQFNVPLNKAFKLNGVTKEYHNLRIQLVDGNGKVVAGPFNDTGVMSAEVK